MFESPIVSHQITIVFFWPCLSIGQSVVRVRDLFPTRYQSSFSGRVFQSVSRSDLVSGASLRVFTALKYRSFDLPSFLVIYMGSERLERKERKIQYSTNRRTDEDRRKRTDGEKTCENSLSPLAQRPTLESRLNSDQHIQSFFL